MAPCLSGVVPGKTWCSTKSSASHLLAWSRFLALNTSRVKVLTVSLFCSGVGIGASSISGTSGQRGPTRGWAQVGGYVGPHGSGDSGRALVGLVHGIGHAAGAGGLGAPLHKISASFVQQGPRGLAPGNHVAQYVVHLEAEPRRAA